VRLEIRNKGINKRLRPTLMKTAVIIAVFMAIFGLGLAAGGIAGVVAYRDGARSGVAALESLIDMAITGLGHQMTSVRSAVNSPQLSQINLEIGFEEFELIRAKRDEAVASGILFTSDADLVPATLTTGGQSLDARVRLKGDLVDHLRTKKWSFRVELEDDHRLFGMRRFSIQHPSTREYQFEQTYFDNLRHEGVLAPRYEFVEVALNGENLGIYALEEFFSRELIESQHRRAGVILGFEEQYYWEHVGRPPINRLAMGMLTESFTSSNAYIDVFESGRIAKNPELQLQADRAVLNLRKFQEGSLIAGDIFDLEKMATFLALTELWQAQHSTLENNMRFYYNPVSGLLEPVGFDGSPTPKLNEQSFVSFGHPEFVKKLLVDPVMMTYFIRELDRVSGPEYLLEIEDILGPKSAESLGSLRKEFPSIGAVWDVVSARQEVLRKLVNPSIASIAYATSEDVIAGRSTISLNIANPLAVPIEVLGIKVIPQSDSSGALADSFNIGKTNLNGTIPLIPGRNVQMDPLEFFPVEVEITDSENELLKNSVEIEVNVRILGQDILRSSPVVLLPEVFGDTNSGVADTSIEDALSRHPYLRLEGSRVFSIGPGEWDVVSDLIVPDGHVLVIQSGTTLRFGTGVRLVTTSAIHLLGEESAPVILEPVYSNWGGVFVQRADEISNWQHALVRGIRNNDEPGRAVTGGVTFNESDLKLRHVTFEGSQMEDALNVILAGIDFEDVIFSNAISDGFDGDAVTGRIERASFLDIGGDGIDISASEIVGTQLVFVQIKDKAVSVGEASRAELVDVFVKGAGIGIASKDLSFVTVEGADFEQIANFALASYQKKPEYGPSTIKAYISESENDTERFVAEGDSVLWVNWKLLESESLDVERLYEVGILGN